MNATQVHMHECVHACTNTHSSCTTVPLFPVSGHFQQCGLARLAPSCLVVLCIVHWCRSCIVCSCAMVLWWGGYQISNSMAKERDNYNGQSVVVLCLCKLVVTSCWVGLIPRRMWWWYVHTPGLHTLTRCAYQN